MDRPGAKQGINDFTGWFAGDAAMSGDYYGYDGPCPPWNDDLLHHYHFRVYALDVPTLGISGRFDGCRSACSDARPRARRSGHHRHLHVERCVATLSTAPVFDSSVGHLSRQDHR